MSASSEVFKKYLNPVFIETGTQTGEGIEMALLAGFKLAYSLEANLELVRFCWDKFNQSGIVIIVHGDTRTDLLRLIQPIKETCTFWLDAHNENDYPVIEELDQIDQHPIKTHTILIDDLRMFHTDKNGLTEQKVKDRILQINPEYKFSYEDGYIKNDILVAKI